jgi:hypothetical protein
MVGARMPSEMLTHVEAMAQEEGLTLSKAILRLVEEGLAKRGLEGETMNTASDTLIQSAIRGGEIPSQFSSQLGDLRGNDIGRAIERRGVKMPYLSTFLQRDA